MTRRVALRQALPSPLACGQYERLHDLHQRGLGAAAEVLEATVSTALALATLVVRVRQTMREWFYRSLGMSANGGENV